MKKLFAYLFIFATLVAGVVGPSTPVFAQDYGLSKTAKSAGLQSDVDLPTLVGNILGTALSLISVLFFALILYAGFLWMTSRGNADQENKAKETLFGAAIGIIIILAAYAITSFVFTNLGPGSGSSNAPNNTQAVLLDAGKTCTENAQCKSNVCETKPDGKVCAAVLTE